MLNYNFLLLINSTEFKKYDSQRFYFVHTYCCKNNEESDIVMKTKYLNLNFTSMIIKENIYACQFHPEKSGTQGLSLLNDMLKK